VLEIPIEIIEAIIKLIPKYRVNFTLSDALVENAVLHRWYENDPQARGLIDYARKIEELPQKTGIHACAVAIADKSLTEYIPLQKKFVDTSVRHWYNNDLENVTQWCKDNLDNAGVLTALAGDFVLQEVFACVVSL